MDDCEFVLSFIKLICSAIAFVMIGYLMLSAIALAIYVFLTGETVYVAFSTFHAIYILTMILSYVIFYFLNTKNKK